MLDIIMLLSNAYRPDARVRREVLALTGEGYDILLLAWDREATSPRREDIDDIHVNRIWMDAGYDNFFEFLVKLPLVWVKMLRRLLKTRFRIVHCHDLDTLPLGLIAARLRSVPCVFDAHELYSEMVRDTTPGPVLRILKWLERRLVKGAELVITVNDALLEAYRGMGARRVVVVMNSPMPEELKVADPATMRERLALVGRGVCVYVGMLEKSRNLDTVLDVFDGMEDVTLIIGGSGTLADAIATRSSDMENVEFVGWIPPEQISSYIAAADIVLLLDDPAYGIIRVATATRLLHAMALGVPAIASYGTATAELVEREGVGVCVKHDDVQGIRGAIKDLLGDVKKRSSMATRGPRAFTERFQWETMKDRLVEAYGDLLLGPQD